MQDNGLRAIIAGFLATLAKDVTDIVYMKLGYEGFYIIKMSAGVFLKPESFSPIYLYIIGYAAHYSLGGLLGFIFYLFLKHFGPQYALLKGIFFGLAVWLILCGGALHFGLSYAPPSNEQGILMLLIDHIFFGATLGLLLSHPILKVCK